MGNPQGEVRKLVQIQLAANPGGVGVDHSVIAVDLDGLAEGPGQIRDFLPVQVGQVEPGIRRRVFQVIDNGKLGGAALHLGNDPQGLFPGFLHRGGLGEEIDPYIQPLGPGPSIVLLKVGILVEAAFLPVKLAANADERIGDAVLGHGFPVDIFLIAGYIHARAGLQNPRFVKDVPPPANGLGAGDGLVLHQIEGSLCRLFPASVSRNRRRGRLGRLGGGRAVRGPGAGFQGRRRRFRGRRGGHRIYNGRRRGPALLNGLVLFLGFLLHRLLKDFLFFLFR